MKRLILVLTMAFAAAAGAQTTNAPRTNFEAFKATPDALLVRGMSTIGVLNNQIQYPVEIRIERLVNQLATNGVYAVSLRTKVGQVTYVDYIDYDELPALIQSVPLISQSTTSVAPMDSFETVFRTRSGLSIAKVGKPTKTVITMTSGDTSQVAAPVRNQMAAFVLDDLGRYLTAAKAQIDSIISSGQ